MRPLLGYGHTCVQLEKHWKHTFAYTREKTSPAMAKFVSKFNSTQSEDTYCTHASFISCTCDYTLGVKGVCSDSAITCWGWMWLCRMWYTWKSVGWFEVCLRGQPCTFHANVAAIVGKAHQHEVKMQICFTTETKCFISLLPLYLKSPIEPCPCCIQVSQYEPYQEPETEVAKWNSANVLFCFSIIYTYNFLTVTY